MGVVLNRVCILQFFFFGPKEGQGFKPLAALYPNIGRVPLAQEFNSKFSAFVTLRMRSTAEA